MNRLILRNRNQPWLLLWLVPYLAFSGLAEGWHTHGRHPATRALQASNVVRHAGHGSADNNDQCLACQWTAQSVGQTSQVQPLTVVSVSIPHFIAGTTVPAPRALPFSQSRGPPVS